MASIIVKTSRTGSGWTAKVTVSEGASQTDHTVTLSQDTFDSLVADKSISPEVLVEKSFVFLLKREPKESILRTFDLTVISRYFPEYSKEIKKVI